MNLVAESPLLFPIGLGVLLILAAIQDAVRLRISNLFPVGIALLAIAAAAVAGFDLAFWQNLVVCAALLIGGTLLFATGKFGGGDVKLFAATGLWFALGGAVQMIAAVLIAGGILALLLIGSRLLLSKRAGERFQTLRKGAGIPYGVAISLGAIFVIATERLM